ncbi:MAG: hypothetical protein WCC87_10390 [Candidatus Korobacteraceae bacterium]
MKNYVVLVREAGHSSWKSTGFSSAHHHDAQRQATYLTEVFASSGNEYKLQEFVAV